MKTSLIYRYSLLLTLVCWLSGCVKEEDDYISKYCPGSCTEVSGQVLRSSGQPVVNMQIMATWKNLEYLSGGTIRKKAVAYTDAQGNYTLRFLLRDDEMQDGYINIEPQGRACNGSTCPSYSIYWDELKRDTAYTHTFLINM